MKIATLSLTLLTLATLQAVDDKEFRNLESRVNDLENRKDVLHKQKLRFQVFLDALLLKATDDSLAYAISNPTTTITLPEGRAYQQTLNPGWGYRLGMAYNLPHDGWDMAASWLHFGQTHHNNVTAPFFESLYPVRLNPAILSTELENFGTINSSWKLRLNQVDLGLGRDFSISRFFKLRPNFGLRYIQIHQHFNIDYFQTGVTPDNFKQRQRNLFWGIGPLFGLDTSWGLGKGWSLYANVDIAAVYGQVKAKNYVLELTKAQLDSITNNKAYATRPMYDITLGVRYERNISQDKYHLGLNLGWEQHVYFAQNQLQHFVNDTAPGTYVTTGHSLTLQGFALGADFCF